MTDADGRMHGLDLLRGVAMLLGIVFHAPVSYFVDIAWFETLEFLGLAPQPQPEGAYLTWSVFYFTHLWRMPLFFILAGFFAAMTADRKGWLYFLKDRSLRITATLIVFMGIFSVTLGRELGEFNHMWFLWQLTLFSGATVLWRMAGLTPLAALKPWHLVLLLPPVMVMAHLFRDNQIWQPLAIHILEPLNLIVLIYYAPFYLVGMGLWHGRGTMQALARTPIMAAWLLTGLAGTVVILGDPAFALPDTVRSMASGAMTLGMSFGLIGLFQRILTRRTAIVDWLIEGSYAIYLFHFFPTILIATGLQLWGMPQAVVVVGAIAGGMVASVVQWYVLVRWTPLDVLLQGPKKARFAQRLRARRANEKHRRS